MFLFLIGGGEVIFKLGIPKLMIFYKWDFFKRPWIRDLFVFNFNSILVGNLYLEFLVALLYLVLHIDIYTFLYK